MRSATFGVGGLVLGSALGFGSGWLTFKTKEAPKVEGPTAVQPTGLLTKENAEKLIADEYKARGGAWCEWNDPSKKSDTRWAFSPYDKNDRACAVALESEGLLKRGECNDTGCGGPDNCCSQWVEAVSPAKFSEELRGLSFPCGDFQVIGVTSVRTEGNNAAVKFRRIFKADDARLKRLEACQMTKPPAGEAELDRQYLRDDSGTWTKP